MSTAVDRGVHAGQLQRAARLQVLELEDLPQASGADLTALGVGHHLDDAAELDLQSTRQVEVVLGPHDVRDAALAGLRVDPDDRLVRAADILRVDRQVRGLPGICRTRSPGLVCRDLERLQAFLDRVLVRSGERRVDQIAGVRVSRVHRELRAVLDRAADVVDVGEVDHRIDALAEEVHAQRHEAHVSGPLTVAEQAALDPISTCHHRQLGRSDGSAAVVVRMQRDATCSRWCSSG